MGLDVYLYERAHEEANNAHSKAWDEWYERFQDVAEADAEKVAAKAAIPSYESAADVPSERYPQHLFNRRYLRSSYNGGGFNRAVPDFLADQDVTLNWIFEPVMGSSEEYSFEMSEASIPALEEAKKRALSIADRLRTCDPLRTMDATAMIGLADHLWSDLPNDDQALAWYREEQARPATPSGEGWYSSAKGTVFGFDKGQEILALTVGRDILGRPCALAVYRGDASSYIESAEITAEFCDEAVMLIRRDGGVFMHWSG